MKVFRRRAGIVSLVLMILICVYVLGPTTVLGDSGSADEIVVYNVTLGDMWQKLEKINDELEDVRNKLATLSTQMADVQTRLLSMEDRIATYFFGAIGIFIAFMTFIIAILPFIWRKTARKNLMLRLNTLRRMITASITQMLRE